MKCGASGDSSRVLLVVYTFRSWEDSAGDAGGIQHLPEHAALGGRLHRHDDAVSQLPAAVSCWNTRQGSAGVRWTEHRPNRLQSAVIPRDALQAEINQGNFMGRIPVNTFMNAVVRWQR